MRRTVAASRRDQPTHTPNTTSHTMTPTPFSHADCSSSEWSRCQRRTWCCMCRRSYQCARSTPGTGESAKNCAHDDEWSSMRSTGSLDSPSSTIPGRAASRRATSSGSAFFRVSRKTPSAPSSRTTAASSVRSSAPRWVPTSHGL